ncbi:MAG: prepilin-type N-terminal cleavage/methylation domain-containing protein [Pirellulales bacterium]
MNSLIQHIRRPQQEAVAPAPPLPPGQVASIRAGEGISVNQKRNPHRLNTRRLSRRERQNYGFTLLEIILSLAILAGAIAALGEVMRLADRNAQMVRDESQAQIMASSVMDELLSGSRAVVQINQQQFDYNTNPPWLYSVSLEQTPYVELVLTRVRVEQQLPPEQQPAHFELVRWMPNPDYIATDTSQQSSTSSSSSSSSSSSTQSAGGLQ